MKKAKTMHVLMFIFFSGLMGCGGAGRQDTAADLNHQRTGEVMVVPDFDSDSAYAFVARQVAFGPRVPNTGAHLQCGNWLEEMMNRFADTVYVQQARVRAYNGSTLNLKNIIGVFQPELRNRILLCAHWDSRPYADWDPDPGNHYLPIDGANDGASGVGVLLEIARQLHLKKPGTGIDIIFFDGEDHGQHRQAGGSDNDTWALGSQHWARNPHKSDYQASFGILLDMVGAANPIFLQEGYSMLYAPNIARKVWDTAHRLGYGTFFPKREGGYITDDHYYINTILRLPTINIIHLDPSTPHGFFPQWHTTSDNIDVIDKETLHMAGQTVLHVIYR